MSQDVKNVATALLAAKRNITAPAKNKKAMYGRYADLEAILTATEPALAEEGLVLSQAMDMTEYGPVLITNLMHAETGEYLSSMTPLLLKDKNDPQKLGSAITYARRYAITALLSIVADDDDDGNTGADRNKDGSAPAKPQKKAVTQERIAEVMKGGTLPEKLVQALVNEYVRADFDKSDIVPEVKAVINRDFKQLSELTEAEARTAVGHARKVKSGDEERLA